jgi:hypothetical protein
MSLVTGGMRRHVRNPALAKWFDKPTLRLRRTFHIDRIGQLGRSVDFVQLDRLLSLNAWNVHILPLARKFLKSNMFV